MNFKIEANLPAEPARIWLVFFDLQRMAALIPGCENVQEKTPLLAYGAVMKQKIGPFKLEVPVEIVVQEHQPEKYVRVQAAGRDKFTGTTLDVVLDVHLRALEGSGTQLDADVTMQVSGRLASLGFSVVKKKSDELFTEFERRLRAELETA